MTSTLPMFNLLAKSPLRPLQTHMSTANECTQLLLPFLKAVIANDWDRAKVLLDEICTLEKKADDLKRDLRLHLPKGLFMPVPRTDILDLLTFQDRVANKTEDIAGLMFGRQMQLPEPLATQTIAFAERCLNASEQANKAISELDNLLESGFGGSETKLVEEMIHELNNIEQDTDDMQINIRRILYGIEKDLPPVDVIFLYKIIEWIGELADRAQQVGARLQLLLAR